MTELDVELPGKFIETVSNVEDERTDCEEMER